jgi:transposase InsO family protein
MSSNVNSGRTTDAVKAVKAVTTAADKIDVAKQGDARLEERFDPAFQAKLKHLRQMKFRDEADLIRWPSDRVGELEEEDGVFSWQGYIVIPQDIVMDVIKAVFESLPPAIGRQALSSHLKNLYIGPSNAQCTTFLVSSDDHMRWRQRRRSNRSTTTVPSAPFKVITADITYVNQTGTIKYVLCVSDSWNKHLWTKALSSLGQSVADAVEEIIQSWPEGVDSFILKTDNGPADFKTTSMKEMLKRYKGKQVFSTPGAVTSQGQVERMNANVKTDIYSIFNRNGVLDKKSTSFIPALVKATKALNNTFSSSHGFIPSQICKPVDQLPPEVVKAIDARLKANAQQTQPNLCFQPFLLPGNKIRIEKGELSTKIKLAQKEGSFKASHSAPFSGTVFTVKRQRADNFVEIEENTDLYSRGACLLVADDAKSYEDDDLDAVQNAAVAPAPKAASKKRGPSQTDGLPVTRKLRSQKT